MKTLVTACSLVPVPSFRDVDGENAVSDIAANWVNCPGCRATLVADGFDLVGKFAQNALLEGLIMHRAIPAPGRFSVAREKALEAAMIAEGVDHA